MSDETIIAAGPVRRIGPGTRLNDLYEIDGLVATGGMGEVYRGHAIETGDEVAIKTIKPEFAQSGSALALFRKEASALHNLYHEAIIRYYVFSIDKPLGLPYLAMEFVSGEALSDIAPRGPLPVEAVDTLRRRLASGLHAAHALGIIHRDVSPDNVILPDGDPARAKIIDFGIARSSLGGATVIGDGFAGKYGYVSPEQLGLFGGEVTPRSDIYSLGLVLAEAALGRRLDMGQNPLDVVERRRRVPDLPGLDAALRPLVEAMLQPDPKNRIGSMAEVAAWTGPVAVGRAAKRKAERTSAKPPARQPPARQPVDPPSARPGPKPPANRAATRGRAPALAGIAVATLAILGGGAYYALQGAGPAGSEIAVDTGPRLEERAATEPAGIPPPAAVAPPAAATPPSAVVPPSIVAPAETALPAAVAPPAAEPRPRPAPSQPAVDPSTQRASPPPASTPRVASTSPVPSLVTPPPALPPVSTPVPPPQEVPPLSSPSLSPAAPAAPPPRRDAVAAPPAVPAPAPIEQVANYIRDYRDGDCFYLVPISVGAREASIEAFGAAPPAFAAFDAAFSASLGFDAKIQLRQVTPAQCGVVDVLARQAVQRRQKLPKLAVNRDRLRSGEELTGTLDLPDNGNAEILLVDDAGEVHDLARNVKRSGRRLTFALRLQAPGPAKAQLLIAVASTEPLAFLKGGAGIRADDLFRTIGEEVGRPNSPVGIAVRYVRLGE